MALCRKNKSESSRSSCLSVDSARDRGDCHGPARHRLHLECMCCFGSLHAFFAVALDAIDGAVWVHHCLLTLLVVGFSLPVIFSGSLHTWIMNHDSAKNASEVGFWLFFHVAVGVLATVGCIRGFHVWDPIFIPRQVNVFVIHLAFTIAFDFRKLHLAISVFGFFVRCALLLLLVPDPPSSDDGLSQMLTARVLFLAAEASDSWGRFVPLLCASCVGITIANVRYWCLVCQSPRVSPADLAPNASASHGVPARTLPDALAIVPTQIPPPSVASSRTHEAMPAEAMTLFGTLAIAGTQVPPLSVASSRTHEAMPAEARSVFDTLAIVGTQMPAPSVATSRADEAMPIETAADRGLDLEAVPTQIPETARRYTPTNPLPSMVRVGEVGGDVLIELGEQEIERLWHVPFAYFVAQRLQIEKDEFRLVLGDRTLKLDEHLSKFAALGYDGVWDLQLIRLAEPQHHDFASPLEALAFRFASFVETLG